MSGRAWVLVEDGRCVGCGEAPLARMDETHWRGVLVDGSGWIEHLCPSTGEEGEREIDWSEAVQGPPLQPWVREMVLLRRDRARREKELRDAIEHLDEELQTQRIALDSLLNRVHALETKR